MAFVFPSTVRSEILAQHEQLRAVAHRAVAETAGSSNERGNLARCTREMCQRFHEHLAFEEKALVPVLWAIDGWGPERVQDLRREHARQRHELDDVIEGLESGWNGDRLALEVTRLAGDLLRDIAEREEGCLRASLLNEGCLSYQRH